MLVPFQIVLPTCKDEFDLTIRRRRKVDQFTYQRKFDLVENQVDAIYITQCWQSKILYVKLNGVQDDDL